MIGARKMGNYIQCLAEKNNIKADKLAQMLGCREIDIYGLFKGIKIPSLSQMEILSNEFNVSVESLIAGDDDVYCQTVVHCMNKFDHDKNREEILDIIEFYTDIFNSVSTD